MDLGLHDWLRSATGPALLGATAAYLAVLYAAFIGIGFAIERGPAGRTRKIYDVPVPKGQYRRELLGTVRFVAIVAPMVTGALLVVRSAPSTGGSFALTFATCLFAFDLYYYAFHRAMHTKRLYRFHRFHHLSRMNTPVTGGSVSAVEAFGWGVGYCAPLLLLSLVTPVSVEAFAAYLAYNTFGNVAGHINAETVPRVFTRAPLGWLNHPTSYHAMHHARVSRQFSFGTPATDFLCGTTWDDWRAVYDRVVAGRPLQRLEERALPARPAHR